MISFESVFAELIKAAPIAVAMLAIVLAFLRYLSRHDEALENISNRCHEIQDRSTVALIENAEALGKNAEVQTKCTSALDRVNITLIRLNGEQHPNA
ncbi:MAG: hypothetical protein ACE5JX_19205 [Acidobacteriota bacterium]